jgi:hypothetical protein
MALKLVNLHKQDEFIPSDDPDKNNPELATKFFYRPLDAYEQAYLNDRLNTIESMPNLAPGVSPEEAMKDMKTRTEAYKVSVECLRIACTGFQNLFDADTGNLVEYETENANIAGRTAPRLKLDIVRRIPVKTCMEFYQKVMAMNQVDASTEKNSGKASSLSNSSTGSAKAATKRSEGSEAMTESQS